MVNEIRNGMSADLLADTVWRKSSRSGAVGNCVELASLRTGQFAVRNSRQPSGPVLIYGGDQLAAFVRRARAGGLTVHQGNGEPAEIEDQLRTLVGRGFQFLDPRDDDGEVVAVVGVRAHDNVIDVVRLHAEDDVVASRLPADADILAPETVYWERVGAASDVLGQLLALPDDHIPAH